MWAVQTHIAARGRCDEWKKNIFWENGRHPSSRPVKVRGRRRAFTCPVANSNDMENKTTRITQYKDLQNKGTLQWNWTLGTSRTRKDPKSLEISFLGGSDSDSPVFPGISSWPYDHPEEDYDTVAALCFGFNWFCQYSSEFPKSLQLRRRQPTGESGIRGQLLSLRNKLPFRAELAVKLTGPLPGKYRRFSVWINSCFCTKWTEIRVM